MSDPAQLGLLSPTGDMFGTNKDAGTDVRVLTWNVQHANAARTRRQVAWLVDDAADVVVLTEVAAGESGELLARWLMEFGYHVWLPRPDGDDRYRVLIACRTGELEPADPGVTVQPHRCAAAKVKTAGTELAVVGVYVPSRGPKEKRNVAKRSFQDAVAAALPGLLGRCGVEGATIVTGDLNVVEPDHEPRYPVFGAWEYDFYRAFDHHGFVDAFRDRRPTGMDYSWFGRPASDGSRNGYRFDHIFVDAGHRDRIRDCRYLHEPREKGLSDHAAMVLTMAR